MKSLGFSSRVDRAVAAHPVLVRGVLIAIGVAGLLVRLIVSQRSHGSNDINLWAGFCDRYQEHGGLGWLYDVNTGFNHPPLMGLMAAALRARAKAWDTRFDFLFKLPEIAADVLAAVLVYRSWSRSGRPPNVWLAPLAFAIFCWNPASILVSAHHGNTDPLCAALSLLAAYLVDRRRPFWAGLALGATINVKLIPVVLIPVFLSCWSSRREVSRFIGGLALGAIPFVPIMVGHWSGFYAHVLQYRSVPGPWGVTSLLEFLGQHRNFAALSHSLTTLWTTHAFKLILLAPTALAVVNWRRGRPWNAPELGAFAYLVFLILTPGFGVQYVVYPIPLLFAADVRRAWTYAAATGLFIFVVYYATWTGTKPYFSNFYLGFPVAGRVFGHLAWLVAIGAALRLLAHPHPAHAPEISGLAPHPVPAPAVGATALAVSERPSV
jgi:hypothetical protein